MAKRSPAEVLDAIDAWDEEDAIDAEMERVLALAPEERERELSAAGFDVEAERAKARAWREKTTGSPPLDGAGEAKPEKAAKAASPNAAQMPKADARKGSARPSRGWWSGGGVAAALAIAAAAILVFARQDDTVGGGRLDDTTQHHVPTPRDRAETLRQKAYAACDSKAWAVCSALLDDAKGIDPAGEADPLVKSHRDAIREAKAP